MPISIQIRQVREELRVSEQELARRVGVTAEHLAIVESGAGELDFEFLERVAAALGVASGRLLVIEADAGPAPRERRRRNDRRDDSGDRRAGAERRKSTDRRTGDRRSDR